ncbi:MAG: dipicolinate synthase subunit DpsA [Acutalibacteraceae bacterium]
MKLCLIGGDKRMVLLPRFLTGNCITASTGNEQYSDIYSYLAKIIKQCDAIILPVPLTRDGLTINSQSISAKIEISKLIDMCSDNKPILGGCVPDEIMRRHNNIYDYANAERFSARNAKLTAEGTLSQMITKSNGTLYDSKVMIVGGGKIANALVPLIKPFTNDITVAARRDEVRQQFLQMGCKAIDTAKLELFGYDYIVNTVPCLLIDENVLKTAKPDAVMLDLATNPCGIDFSAAERLNIKAYLLAGVPGKCSPYAAAKVIADEIETILKGIDRL